MNIDPLQNFIFPEDIKPQLVLHDYQAECVDKILWEYNQKLDGNALCVLPTGSGKSLIIASIASQLGDKHILIFQPSLEILQQNYEKLLRYIPKEDIGIYSASAKEKTIRKITLATIGSCYKVPELFSHVEIVLIDECFIAGTKVSGKNIEDIRQGDYVNSFNHKTGFIEPKKVLGVSKKWHTDNLTNINNGLTISTGNHPIYIYGKGYQKADETTKHDKIIFYKSDLFGVQKRHYEGDEYRDNGKLGIQKDELSQKEKGFLFKNLFKRKNQQRIIGKNDKEKSNDVGEKYLENERNIKKDWPQTTDPRRQWERDDGATNETLKSSWGKLVRRIDFYNKKRIFTISLQNRYSKPRTENSDRSGRIFSLFEGCSKKRQEERGFFEIKRVDSVSFQESGDNTKHQKGCWVYNLEVEDNNNYFANGVLVHNCHLVSPKATGSMFMSFLKAIGQNKVYGFTATPYRLDSMYTGWGTDQCRIVTTTKLINRMKGFFWTRILYNMSMKDLIDREYLCMPTYIDASVINQEEIPLNVSRSEFDMDKFEQIMLSREGKIMNAIKYGEENSKSVLVFCSSVSQATRYKEKTAGSAVVTAKTPAKERDQMIIDFKEGKIKTVFNVGVLTTGFDFPELDCIILLRPTRSIMLYVQMLGRGVRIAEGKYTCKIIDLTSTVKNMGRVETIRLVKEPGSMWELRSETKDNWHGVELYSFAVPPKAVPQHQISTIEDAEIGTDFPL